VVDVLAAAWYNTVVVAVEEMPVAVDAPEVSPLVSGHFGSL